MHRRCASQSVLVRFSVDCAGNHVALHRNPTQQGFAVVVRVKDLVDTLGKGCVRLHRTCCHICISCSALIVTHDVAWAFILVNDRTASYFNTQAAKADTRSSSAMYFCHAPLFSATTNSRGLYEFSKNSSFLVSMTRCH